MSASVIKGKLRAFQDNPALFRANMLVDADAGPTPFLPDPWQADDFSAFDFVWQRCVGLLSDGGPKSCYSGRSRGHSKTTDQALSIIWAMTFAPKIISGIAAAASRDQAQIIRDRIQTLVMLNPWLAKVLDIQNYKVYNINRSSPAFGSTLDIISSDAPSQYGAIADFVICDELTHWRGNELWGSVMSTVAKRDNCALFIMTNAGTIDSWQHKIFHHASTSTEWVFKNHEGVKASWIKPDRLVEQKLLLPRKSYDRLWNNAWQTEGGDALEVDDIRNCIADTAGPMSGDELGWEFVAGLDLSTKRHRSALVVIGCNSGERRMKLAYSRNWKPRDSGDRIGTVDLMDVLQTVINVNHQFKLVKVCYDPHQAGLLAEAAIRSGVTVEESPMQGHGAHVIASTILQVFRSRQIELYKDHYLLNDLSKLNITEKRGLFKLEATEDSTGHADSGLAFALALPSAVQMSSVPLIRPFIDRDRVLIQTIDDLHNREAEIELRGKLEVAGLLPAVIEEKDLMPELPDSPIPDDPKQRTMPCDECGSAIVGTICRKCQGMKRIPIEQARNLESARFAMALEENGLGEW